MPTPQSSDLFYLVVWFASAMTVGVVAGLAAWYLPLYAYRIARNLYRRANR